jgi:hypothetical protein
MTQTSELQLKVWIEDVWDTVHIAASPDWSVGRVKEEALRSAIGNRVDPADYQVKFKGALVLDERNSLSQLHVPHMAPLAVLSSLRRPVR